MLKTKKWLASILCLALVFTTLIVGGGTLTANAQGESPAELTLIDTHDTWKYHDANINLFGDIATDFRSKSFDDSNWESGPAPLGYSANESDAGLFGKVSEGGTLLENKSKPDAYITYYFRNEFELSDIAGITNLIANISFDDGYVLYLNGREIDRMYMPEGDVGHHTTATYVNEASSQEGQREVDLTAYRSYLVRGKNTIAVDVHNRDNQSSDIYFGMNLTAHYDASSNPSDADKTPSQVNVHVGDDASQVNITYTTLGSADSKAVLMKADDSKTLSFTGESSVGGGNKYYHKIAVSGLEAGATYLYTVGSAPNTFSGQFKTAPAKGSKEPIKFVYLADTQVSNGQNAKALGATLAEVNNMNPDFVYLAGDITDTATSEAQWEWLFGNEGQFKTGGRDMFGNYLIAATQGNHDNSTFNRHINAPAEEGNVVYSFDYGPMTFVILNLETAKSDATAGEKQKIHLENAVADAKARGQWTAVGFHKSLYTGASHITDSDVIAARKYWCPIFAELDVDMVLQGHDHVYSRGFITAEGKNANPQKDGNGVVQSPENAPLYMVGGHAGGLKWYSKKNYTVGTGDPLAAGYSFLDVNSTDTGSDVKREQVIVELEVSDASVTVNCYMFKYDTASDTITTEKYLYDTMTMERELVTSDITGPELAVAETGEEVQYTVSYNNLVNANAFDTEIEYDSDVLEFVDAESFGSNVLVHDVTAADGKARVITGLGNVIGSAAKQDIVTFTFKVKTPVHVDSTTVTLKKADTVKAFIEDGKVTVSKDITGSLDQDKAVTAIYSYEKASDIDGNGRVTLADLSMALSRYQSTAAADKKYDINLDGVVDGKDFVIISSYIKTA